MAITSNAVQRPTPQARRREPAFAHSFGPNSRLPFEPPNALSAALIKSLRKSRQTHCSRLGEPTSDRHSREPAQGAAPNYSTRAAGLAAPRPARISKLDFSFRRSAMLRFALAVAIFLGLTAAQAQTVQKAVPADPGEVRLSFAPVVKKARPAVVNVYASRVETMPRNPLFDDPVFRQLFGQNSRTAQSLGSGVIVDPS